MTLPTATLLAAFVTAFGLIVAAIIAKYDILLFFLVVI